MLLVYEAKSNNLSVLRDETLTSLHSLVGKLDSMQQAMVQARSIFTFKLDEAISVFNMQMPNQNPGLSQAANLIQTVNKGAFLNLKRGIPFEEQVAIMKKLEQQDK